MMVTMVITIMVRMFRMIRMVRMVRMFRMVRMVRMVRMFRVIRVMIVFVGNRKANKEEQGRKCYNDDSGEKHLVGLEETGHSSQAEEHPLGG